ncbi:MAG: hypothetical protein ACI9ZV_000539 [Candidatus Azotimanducaceae bacterium]|jgi:hypothetical protein
MHKIYDKLILAAAVLLLAGGVLLYLQESSAAPSLTAPVNIEPADNPYQAVPIAESKLVEANWPEATAQPAGPRWIYDVFTPPKIYMDLVTKQFTADPPVKLADPVPFGIYLAEIERNPYRIQLEGYVEEDLSDASKSLLLIFNEETQKQVRARPGDVKVSAEFKLLSFDIERIRDSDNNIQKVATAVILDQRSGEEVALIHGERLFDFGVTVVIKSAENPSFEKVLTEAFTDFEGPSGSYSLKEINLEESSVLVEKKGLDDVLPEVRTLRVRNESKESPPINTPATTEKEDMFDFTF